MNVGYSPIPSPTFLHELEDDEFRNGFVADHVRARLALLIRYLREQRGWSQAELGRRLGKPQSVISRLEDPDYGRLSLQTVFEIAAAFKLPVYIDLPNWDEWFRLMEDMSSRSLKRQSFDVEHLASLANDLPQASAAPKPADTTASSLLVLSLTAITSTVTYGDMQGMASTGAAVASGAILNEPSALNAKPGIPSSTARSLGQLIPYLATVPAKAEAYNA